jgi:hypothetical protein
VPKIFEDKAVHAIRMFLYTLIVLLFRHKQPQL